MDPSVAFENVKKRFSDFSKIFYSNYEKYSFIEFAWAACYEELFYLSFILQNIEPLLEQYQKAEISSSYETMGKVQHEIRFWVIDFTIHARIFMDRLVMFSTFLLLGRSVSKFEKTGFPGAYRSFAEHKKIINKKGRKFEALFQNFPEQYLDLVQNTDWFDDFLKDPRDHYTHLPDPSGRSSGLIKKMGDKWDVRIPTPIKIENLANIRDTKSIRLREVIENLTDFLNKYLDFFEKFIKLSRWH